MRSPNVFTVDDNGQLQVSKIAGEVTGIDLMLQKIVKFFLTIPGSNIADPNYGTLLGDKANLAYLGSDVESVRTLLTNVVDSANIYFKGTADFDHMELNNVYISEIDPTVFYSEIFVYLADGSIYNITV